MHISITYKDSYNGIPYTAASVETPFTDMKMALQDAFGKTQNAFSSWSEKPQSGVTVCHYKFDGSPLRSSMVGDEFIVWTSEKDFKKFEVAKIGFKEIA
tara:strand:+ start:81 stop:377 length:297 start_codon:yes stop_codon:yes gene_type:complete